MASPSRTIFLASSSSSSPLFISFFFFCFTMHACISSDARNIRADDVKSLQGCEQAFTSTSSASPCTRIIRAEFVSRTRSGTVAAVSSSSDHDYSTAQNEVSAGASRSRASSENSRLNDHQDFTEMDYHPPHRNSPIHNR